jgi:hypothetical protein
MWLWRGMDVSGPGWALFCTRLAAPRPSAAKREHNSAPVAGRLRVVRGALPVRRPPGVRRTRVRRPARRRPAARCRRPYPPGARLCLASSAPGVRWSSVRRPARWAPAQGALVSCAPRRQRGPKMYKPRVGERGYGEVWTSAVPDGHFFVHASRRPAPPPRSGNIIRPRSPVVLTGKGERQVTSRGDANRLCHSVQALRSICHHNAVTTHRHPSPRASRACQTTDRRRLLAAL